MKRNSARRLHVALRVCFIMYKTFFWGFIFSIQSLISVVVTLLYSTVLYSEKPKHNYVVHLLRQFKYWLPIYILYVGSKFFAYKVHHLLENFW